MWCFWENDVIYSNSQPRKINGGRKGPKKWILMIVMAWNLARSLGTHCVRKCKKLDIETLVIVALKHSFFIYRVNTHLHICRVIIAKKCHGRMRQSSWWVKAGRQFFLSRNVVSVFEIKRGKLWSVLLISQIPWYLAYLKF